jgi:hypothetical protein
MQEEEFQTVRSENQIRYEQNLSIALENDQGGGHRPYLNSRTTYTFTPEYGGQKKVPNPRGKGPVDSSDKLGCCCEQPTDF